MSDYSDRLFQGVGRAVDKRQISGEHQQADIYRPGGETARQRHDVRTRHHQGNSTCMLCTVIYYFASAAVTLRHISASLSNNNNLHKPALPVKNWRILLIQSFTARMPLLMATSEFRLQRRCWSFPLRCYLVLMSLSHTHTCLTAPFPGLPGWAGNVSHAYLFILNFLLLMQ